MYLVYLVICVHLANMFLAYFVGVDKVHDWIWTSPPWQHPAAFAVVAFITGLMMFDFCYWREQLCIIGCPYGRFQSVMLDRSMRHRWLRRAAGRTAGQGARSRRQRPRPLCRLPLVCGCVPHRHRYSRWLATRVHWLAQCIDVCDDVMEKTNQPKGLIRYSSQSALEGQPTRVIRPRTIIYLTAITLLVGAFVTVLVNKSPFDVTVLRGLGRPFVVDDSGSVENILRVRIVNRSEEPMAYRIEVEQPDAARITHGAEVEQVGPGQTIEQPVHVHAPRDVFQAGRTSLVLRITDEQDQVTIEQFFLLGP